MSCGWMNNQDTTGLVSWQRYKGQLKENKQSPPVSTWNMLFLNIEKWTMSCLRSRFFVCLFQKLSVAEITLSSDLAKDLQCCFARLHLALFVRNSQLDYFLVTAHITFRVFDAVHKTYITPLASTSKTNPSIWCLICWSSSEIIWVIV